MDFYSKSADGFLVSAIISRPILKEGKKWKVRILRPVEFALLREGAVNSSYQVQLDALLYSGMRYVEMQRLSQNKNWLDESGFVYLPQTAVLKMHRRQLNRWVKLNSKGLQALKLFIRGDNLPVWETWTIWMKEWAERMGLDPVGLGPKTTRKTWESWLAFYFGQNHLLEIVQSQGHTTGTSLHHYLSMPFLPRDKEQMGEFVSGMF